MRDGAASSLACAALGLAIGMLATAAIAQVEHRQLGTHQHGHGTVNIAIEGPQLIIELDVPGMDVLGFEHAPGTPEQKSAVDRVEALLRDPLGLFVVPAAARCRTRTVELEREGDTAAGHLDYRVEYVLDCAAPAALTWIEFAYFDRLPGGEQLDVSFVSAGGQSAFIASRTARRLDLSRAH